MPPGIALVLLGAIALAVLRVLAAVFAPVVRIAFLPRTLCTRLIVLVVGVALAFGPLPAPPSLTLTGGFCAIALKWDLRTRPEHLAACHTSRDFHGYTSWLGGTQSVTRQPKELITAKPESKESATWPQPRASAATANLEFLQFPKPALDSDGAKTAPIESSPHRFAQEVVVPIEKRRVHVVLDAHHAFFIAWIDDLTRTVLAGINPKKGTFAGTSVANKHILTVFTQYTRWQFKVDVIFAERLCPKIS